MPVTPRPLASAMMVPTRAVAIPTTPGRQVHFRSGMATINDTRDLVILLRRSDVRIMFSAYSASWLPDVLAQVPEIKAQVSWPEGFFPQTEDEPEDDDEDDDEDDEAEDTVRRVLDERSREWNQLWRKPPSS